MWISAAIGEELLFRAFAFSQLKKWFGKNNFWLVLLIAVMFSLPHLYQGISGLVMTFLFGLAFGFIYLKFKNIWINIIVHGLVDTVFLTLSYYGLTDFYSGLNIIL
jgi:membrane protease YdiL (CAAX protease family)